MAKLYLSAESDKGGRITGKGGDEYIKATFRNGNIAVFDVYFRDDGARRGTLEIMSYNDGKSRIFEYMRGDFPT